ncbi:MAG: hypothetical protein V4458_13175 [Pseudomonadota bacterium]
MLSIDRTLFIPLHTTMSVEDCYDLIEVVRVDAHNARVLKARR